MNKKTPFTLSQLGRLHKVQKVADVIVVHNSALLKNLYEDIEHPQTFEAIARQVLPASELEKENPRFLKSVIHCALKKVFKEDEEDKMSIIREKRKEYFSAQLLETIETKYGPEKLAAIRYLGGITGKCLSKDLLDHKRKIAEKQGYRTWTDAEIDFLYLLLQDPQNYLGQGTNKGDIDYSKILPALNGKFHHGKDVRDSEKVGRFLYKRARSKRSDAEITLLHVLCTSSHCLIGDVLDYAAIAKSINKIIHKNKPIRSATSIGNILKRETIKQKKMKNLGIIKD